MFHLLSAECTEYVETEFLLSDKREGQKRKQKEPELFLCGNMLLLSALCYQVYFKQLGKQGISTVRLCVITVHSI